MPPNLLDRGNARFGFNRVRSAGPAMRVWRASPGDEGVIRRLRLRAIADSPDAFDTTLEHERAVTAEERRGWLMERAVFVLETALGPAGIAVGEPHRSDPKAVFLASVWVDPRVRGSGAAAAVVAPVLAWAREIGAGEIHLHVGARNERARRFYEKCGFRATGGGFARPLDGLVEVEMTRRLG